MIEAYAHTHPDYPGDPSRWQPLEEHLRSVSQKAAEFAAVFGSAEWARAAGLLHDFGKAGDAFQAYLRHTNGLRDDWTARHYHGRTEHAWAGACHAEGTLSKQHLPLGRPLAYVVDGHHAGLADWHTAGEGAAALKYHLAEKMPWLAGLQLPDLAAEVAWPARLPSFVKANNAALWIRMLFSCLVDADFLDTEAFMDATKSMRRPTFDPLPVLKAQLDAHLRAFTFDSPVNRIRAGILAQCRARASSHPGFFSLSVPTGGGKTLSSLSFALDHALAHGKSRMIYVIPYTSIIEQTADVFRKAVGSANVIEHHSNLAPEKDTPRCRLASENWDAPLVVTTNVQFFESLFAAHPSRCRKLHNIANSIVILDEAQLVPPQYLDPIQDAMRDLVSNYGVSVVISTATQPAFSRLAPCIEMMDDPPALFAALRRATIAMPADPQTPVAWEALAADVLRHETVLCVVNRRAHARTLLGHLPSATLHLSAQMCGAHRADIIAQIKQCLQAHTPVRVVSTQLIEAGVDLDFPVVYRAMAGLDSIAQAAGRCNREGRLNDPGQVIVFVPPEGPPPGILCKAESTTRELLHLGFADPLDPAAYPRFFGLFFRALNNTGQDISDLLRPDPQELGIAFRTVERLFRIVDDSGQQAVIAPYGDYGEWLDELRRIGPTRDNMRRLQRYTVNLPRRAADALRAAGQIEVIADEFWTLTGPKCYDARTGVRLPDDRDLSDPANLMVFPERSDVE